MAGKKQQTFAKLTRERKVREKRERKAEKKAERRLAEQGLLPAPEGEDVADVTESTTEGDVDGEPVAH
jgi:hypothetical protein